MNIYREIFKVVGQRPLIVRTLDIGGDKPPSYLPFPQEMNPFLGWRAIRISLDLAWILKTQLRAILRAAVGYQARIMFPMVSDLNELRRARHLVDEVKLELKHEKLSFADDVPVGIMVETPAAAVLVDVLSVGPRISSAWVRTILLSTLWQWGLWQRDGFRSLSTLAPICIALDLTDHHIGTREGQMGWNVRRTGRDGEGYPHPSGGLGWMSSA